MKKSAAVIGLQWGDEGKARVIDYLTEKSDFVVRFQGGSNAGHTVVANGKKHVFHLIPSGMLHDGVVCLVGHGVVLDPWAFKGEVDQLKADIPNIESRIRISPSCHLVLPWHQKLDVIYEDLKGDKKIGTTGRGVGPCYSDKALRHGIKVSTLIDPDLLNDRIDTVLPIQNAILEKVGGLDPIDREELMKSLYKIADWIRPFVDDVPNIIKGALDNDKYVLFEGAQSVMLDIDYGTYPFVTSSNSSLTGLYAGCGVNPKDVNEVWGITKAYCTRVGEGPFPSELLGEEGAELQKKGHEFGATTGRPRRCGWIDLANLKYAIETSGITHIALTKLDVLSGYKEIKICTGYKGETHRIYYTHPHSIGNVENEYLTMPGWEEDLSDLRDYDSLPQNAKNFIEKVESLIERPIKLITIGASREQSIVRD
jgi:adenylosuccinate synthase